MCGRFVSYFDPAELAGVFDADQVTDLPGASWNVAPTSQVAVVRETRQNGRGPQDVSREVRGARWGLVPSWAKDLSVGGRFINARSETVTVRPAFRPAAKSRRGLVPAAGYYEWQAGSGGPKTPFFLHPEDEGMMAMAALYEWWWPPVGEPRGDLAGAVAAGPEGTVTPSGAVAAPLFSVTILTRAATDALGAVHDRMPLVVPPEWWEAWLSHQVNTPAAVAALIESIPDPVLVPRRVGRAVGSVRNNGPSLIQPV
ncbi:MAG: SOS response-associated peptidase [Bifidobacteriaceae bacterium]|jgi:putative SOS response-associated peptidase YedK|nr:SOS response-associated peptidase [Bifidobacteriaceae bacterium]